MNKILIIEDEKILNNTLKEILEKEGYLVKSVYTFEEAEAEFENMYNVYLIDINLGYKSGFELFKKLKTKVNLEEVVTIFLTARDEIKDNVMGLDLGADDYITKPFNTEILISKIRNLIRKKNKDVKITRGIYTLDTARKKIYIGEEEISLTYIEYEIMEHFFEKGGWIISREQIKDIIYNKTDNYVNDNTVSVYIKRIREKVGMHEGKYIIESVRGMGYKLSE